MRLPHSPPAREVRQTTRHLTKANPSPACIGRKFAEVEMVAVLSLLVRTYQILPLGTPDPSEVDTGAEATTASSHEPTLPELLTEKLLETKPGVTLTPREIGVRLVKRRGGDVRRPEVDL